MAVRKRVAPAASGISTHAEYTRLLQLKTKEEIKAHLEGVLNTLMDLAFAQKSNSSKSAAEQIKEIVDREYQKDLSVERSRNASIFPLPIPAGSLKTRWESLFWTIYSQ